MKEGIFRLTPSFKEIEKLLAQIQSEKLGTPQKPLSISVAHEVAGILKCFLCDLEAPVLMYELYELWIAIASNVFFLSSLMIRTL
jgi:hypothetical protein